MIFFNQVLWILFLSINVSAEEKKTEAFRGWTVKDCECERHSDYPEAEKWPIEKSKFVGTLCSSGSKKQIVSCDNGFMSYIECPKDCIELRKISILTLDDLKKDIDKINSEKAKPAYLSKAPQVILDSIEKKYKDWVPAIYNKGAPYFSDFQLGKNFYLEVPLQIKGSLQAVSVVYFFKDLQRMMSGKINWSFWIKSTGELLYNEEAPYPIDDGISHNIPCKIPFGKNFETFALYALSSDAGSIGGCCGPYTLENLITKGPELYKDLGYGHSMNSYEFCNDYLRAPEQEIKFYEIDGPANIREPNLIRFSEDNKSLLTPLTPDKSPVIGQCADRSRTYVVHQSGDWLEVLCEGKRGWTHKKNVRGYGLKTVKQQIIGYMKTNNLRCKIYHI